MSQEKPPPAKTTRSTSRPLPDPGAKSGPAIGSSPRGGDVFRLLHTADWHLGKMLGDRDRIEEHRRFLEWLLATILEYRVDTLLVAGDVFDSPRPPQSATQLYFDFLSRVFRQSDCQVIVTAGNHDSPGHLDAPRSALRALNVHVVGELPGTLGDLMIPLPSADAPEVVVAAVPFLRDRDLRSGKFGQTSEEIAAELCEGIARKYQAAADLCSALDPRVARVAMGHLTVLGSQPCTSERGIHVGGLGSVGEAVFPEVFQYVALGHLHRPQTIRASQGAAAAVGDPVETGFTRVAYSGSPIPLGYSEARDAKSVRLADFRNGQLAGQTVIPVPVFRRLVSLDTIPENLSDDLAAVPAGEDGLETWIELNLTTDQPAAVLIDSAHALVAGRNAVITKISVRGENGPSRLEHDPVDFSRTASLLDDPFAVFETLLQQIPESDAAEGDEPESMRVGLRRAFVELVESAEQSDGMTELPSRELRQQDLGDESTEQVRSPDGGSDRDAKKNAGNSQHPPQALFQGDLFGGQE